MTGMVTTEVIASPGPRRGRSARGAVWREAVVTGAAVTAAFALAVTTLPAAPTPSRVAETFVQALFDEDWNEAWTLLCPSDREHLGPDVFARRMAALDGHASLPSEVDLAVDGIRPAPELDGPQLTVSVTATSDEPDREDWSLTGTIPLIVEDGTLRVCFLVGRASS